METVRPMLAMKTMFLCGDVQFLGITRSVLNELRVNPQIVASAEGALGLIQAHEFDVVIVDWREIDNVADFVRAVRRSRLNYESVLVAIVRDLLDLKQAFAAGVQFLIHKPASAMQIERCLRAAYCATVARRRKQHREPVQIAATLSTHSYPLFEAVITNLSEGGAGIQISPSDSGIATPPGSGEEVEMRFASPKGDEMLDVSARVVWTTAGTFGVKFLHIPDAQKTALECWLTECVERSLAELCDRIQSACA